MQRNEEGEFELILGNRQLLSVFFIVVILLGVFFTMGYIVGRNSSTLVADAGRKTDKPILVDSASRPTSPVETKPYEAPPAALPPAEPESKPVKKVEEKPVEKPVEKRAATASPVPDQPQSGQTYLQLAAMGKPEAELFVDVLGKKNFHALYMAVPEKPGLFRVLVGPFKDTGAVAQARTDLQKAGFKGFEAIAKKF